MSAARGILTALLSSAAVALLLLEAEFKKLFSNSATKNNFKPLVEELRAGSLSTESSGEAAPVLITCLTLQLHISSAVPGPATPSVPTRHGCPLWWALRSQEEVSLSRLLRAHAANLEHPEPAAAFTANCEQPRPSHLKEGRCVSGTVKMLRTASQAMRAMPSAVINK